ncbi:carbohydrate ABC transporter permease [Anaerocolumna sp. AGMB13025]|uniref:carbohydrate ABC transporter permease n=1 Tax=Anaerocolumna sp. AGMB13025 TaxID=3039116 RepID=UPI00241F4698|nr:carbohydrate ABC transporter permease [Anaerocolumna sp. AGMB13025]WFR57293.1 carbohydrate ABC transporter permease [Anaerocolumna sp. AGMB13025]
MQNKVRKTQTKEMDKLFYIVTYTVMLILLFVCLYPFYYVFIYSISDPSLAQKGITFLPKGITITNYSKVLSLDGILRSFFISLSRTVLGSGLTVLACSFFAYLVTKNIYGRRFIYRFVIITMYLNAGLIPWYLTLKSYHLTNTFWVYIIPSAISAYYVVLLKTFIENLPVSLEESAKLDGAGYVTIFAKIVFPLSKPILATITVFSAVAQWNNWFDNYILVQSEKLETLQLMLYNYLNQASQLSQMSTTSLQHGAAAYTLTAQSVRMTITMVATLPILFVYPFMQKYFVKGIMLGAVKG